MAWDFKDPDIPAVQEGRLRRAKGQDQSGTVELRDFDRGIVETLGAFIENQRYWLTIDGIDPPPGKPGVLVTFSFPEAEFKSYVLPLVLIRRDDISPANERWHPGNTVYRTPAAIGVPIVYGTQTGYSRMEEAQQAVPFDITYTISVLAHYRGAIGQRGQVHKVLQHILRTYPPYAAVTVQDSIGDPREYHVFTESTAVLDEHPEVAERVIGFGVTLRVEAELDLAEPRTYPTVTQSLTMNLKPL